MDKRMVTVTLEMDLIEGDHFPYDGPNKTGSEVMQSAIESFIAYLDSWCGESDKETLRDYIQAKLVYK